MKRSIVACRKVCTRPTPLSLLGFSSVCLLTCRAQHLDHILRPEKTVGYDSHSIHKRDTFTITFLLDSHSIHKHDTFTITFLLDCHSIHKHDTFTITFLLFVFLHYLHRFVHVVRQSHCSASSVCSCFCSVPGLKRPQGDVKWYICWNQIDDPKDEIISLILQDSILPEGFQVCNTQLPPGVSSAALCSHTQVSEERLSHGVCLQFWLTVSTGERLKGFRKCRWTRLSTREVSPLLFWGCCALSLLFFFFFFTIWFNVNSYK